MMNEYLEWFDIHDDIHDDDRDDDDEYYDYDHCDDDDNAIGEERKSIEIIWMGM